MALSDYIATAAPGIGTAIGGGLAGPVGAALGGAGGGMLSQYLRGLNKDPFEQEAKSSQLELLQSLRQKQPFQRVAFDPSQEQRQFEEQVIPGLAERFTGMGGQRSSAFRQQLAGAGGDLAQRLAGLRSQHELGQQQAEMQAQGMDLNRLSQLQALLSGQQQLGLQRAGQQQQQLGQLGQLGLGLGQLGQRYGESQQQAQSQNVANMLKALGLASGQQFETAQQPGQAGAINPALKALFAALGGR